MMHKRIPRKLKKAAKFISVLYPTLIIKEIENGFISEYEIRTGIKGRITKYRLKAKRLIYTVQNKPIPEYFYLSIGNK